MRLGIAGCGRIAERGYVPAALATPGVEIVAFADPHGERLARCRELWEDGGGPAATYDDVAALVEQEQIDLLVVATPADFHLAGAEAAAAAGVRSLVEKPPAADLAEARRLASLEPAPLLAFNRRFLQGAELRNSLPDGGWLELDLQMSFRQSAWGAHEVRDEALLDAGVHLIDLASHLSASEPISVRQATVGPERASFELELSRARARIGCSTDARHRELAEVRDRAGKLLARSRHGGVRGRLATLAGAPDPLLLSLRRQLAALRDGRAIAAAEDGVAAMAVVEAVRRSASLDGAEVTVDLAARARP